MAGESAQEAARKAREKAARLQRYADNCERGAEGERATASALEALGPDWVVFHDQRWPGRRLANIDHVAVGPGGIFVIDSKHWSGKVDVVGDRLRCAGYSKEKVVASAADAALAVAELVGEHASAVQPVLCFVGKQGLAGWVRDVMVCTDGDIAEMMHTRPAVLGAAQVSEVAVRLEVELRSKQEAPEPRPRQRRAAGSSRPAAKKAARPSARKSARPRKGRQPSVARLMVGFAVAATLVLAGPTLLPVVADAVGGMVAGQVSPDR
jgi:hypothetical protein